MVTYRHYVIVFVLLYGVLDGATAAYAVHLNWVWEVGLVLSWVLEWNGIGAKGWGPAAVIVVKAIVTLGMAWVMLRYEDPIRVVPRWPVVFGVLYLLALYGTFTNTVFIYKVTV